MPESFASRAGKVEAHKPFARASNGPRRSGRGETVTSSEIKHLQYIAIRLKDLLQALQWDARVYNISLK